MTPLPERTLIIGLVNECMNHGARQSKACQVIDLSVRTLQRWQIDEAADNPIGDLRPTRIQTPSNQFSQAERDKVLSVANSAEFAHLPPSQIVPRLADQGLYIGSESSMYRILRHSCQLTHRTSLRPAKARYKPRAILATAPKQLFSWDITYLPTPIKGSYFYLYLFMDVFSRKIVGWQVYDCESSELAAQVMTDICHREGITPGQVQLHSDNGSPMRGATLLATLQEYGVMPSFSRPAVSNDNPYSEALFKTLKYHSIYPKKPFESLLAARVWVGQFVAWYNKDHRHSATRFVTPNERHEGLDKEILAKRVEVYGQAKQLNPNRWSGDTRNWTPITEVHLNPNKQHQPTDIENEVPTRLKKAA
jgi:putative transposase